MCGFSVRGIFCSFALLSAESKYVCSLCCIRKHKRHFIRFKSSDRDDLTLFRVLCFVRNFKTTIEHLVLILNYQFKHFLNHKLIFCIKNAAATAVPYALISYGQDILRKNITNCDYCASVTVTCRGVPSC